MVREGWALEAIFESQLVREPFLAVDGRVIAQNSYGLESIRVCIRGTLSWLTAWLTRNYCGMMQQPVPLYQKKLSLAEHGFWASFYKYEYRHLWAATAHTTLYFCLMHRV